MKNQFVYRKEIKMWLFRNIIFCYLIILCSCSTTKNNFFSRKYHNTTSKYNAFFNAKENIKSCEKDIDQNFIENYDKILSFYKTSRDASAHNSRLDKAIKKATKNIMKHSIMEDGQEFCKWIDDSYFIVAKSYYYKKDYIKAKEILKYIIGTYTDEKIIFGSQILLVKCYIESSDVYFAEIELEKIIIESKNQEKQVCLLGAYINFLNNNIDQAIIKTQNVIELEKNTYKKSRYYYILAQLHEQQHNFEEAYNVYNKVVKKSSDYEMVFNSKLKKAKVVDIQKNTTIEIEEELNSMLKDEKNTDYYYQLYLSLAELKLRQKDTVVAISLFSKATKNIKEANNFEAYLSLAKIFYNKKDYKKSQKYYDSTMVYLDKGYKKYDEIKDVQENLTDLVHNFNIITHQDSLIKISNMTEKERNKIIDKIIQDRIKKEQESDQNRFNQTNIFGTNTNNLGLNSVTQNRLSEEQNRQFGTNWYFYNNATLTFGYSSFKKRWGKRKLEDNWRRANKNTLSIEEYYAVQDSLEQENIENDPTKRETYLKNLPLEESQKLTAYNKIISSTYNIAKIYQDKLKDYLFAEKYFLTIINQYPNSSMEPLVLCNLILFYDERDQNSNKLKYTNRLIKQYPKNQYTYLIENKNNISLNKDTLSLYFVDLWYKGDYKKIYDTYDNLPLESKNNPNLNFIVAITKGQTHDFNKMKKDLEDIKNKYPEHEVSDKAEEILKHMISPKNTVNENIDNNLEEEGREEYSTKETAEYYFIMLFPKIETTPNKVKNIISDFHIENQSLLNLNISNVLFGKEQHMIIVRDFKSSLQATEYFNQILKNQEIKEVTNNQNEMFIISSFNFQMFFKKQDLIGYRKFFQKTY